MRAHRMRSARALAFGALLCATLSGALAQTAAPARDPSQLDARTRREVLDELARKLDAQYAIPATASALAAQVRAKQKANAYKGITSAPQFARALTSDLYAIAHDKHLHVNYSFGPVPQQTPGAPAPEVLERMRKLNGMIPKVEILEGNVGYMRVNGVPPLDVARDAVAAAFAFLHVTDALIIDNRGNTGGDPNTVALYMSYLSEGEPFVVNTFHWRERNRVEEFRTTELGELSYGASKPVFVLSSAATFSGGEELTYDIQVFKRGVVVGEVSGGGANPGGPEPLGHQFVANIPRGQAVNPVTGTSWEGVGVKPDIAVPAKEALDKAHALAIERLIAGTRDPVPRSMLEAVAMQLESIAAAQSGSAEHLPNEWVTGTYAMQAGSGPRVTVLEKDGRLICRVEGRPDAALVVLKGNRYTPEGFPDGYVMSFLVKEGSTYLLMEPPLGPPTLREKR